jgi:mRNA export factor
MSLFAKASEPKDAEVVNPPLDSVSAVSWSPTADFLAVSSWSNEVRIYQVAGGGANQGSAMYRHEAPVLCVQWSKVRFLFLPMLFPAENDSTP